MSSSFTFPHDERIALGDGAARRLPRELELVRFAPRHLAAMALRAGDAHMLAWSGGAASAAPVLATRGPSVTLLAHGHVAACAGIALFWPGSGEAWCAASPWVDAHPIFFCRIARGIMKHLAAAAKAHRVQAHVPVEHPRAARFAAWLGFEPEGDCPGYGPQQENVIRYRRLFTCKP